MLTDEPRHPKRAILNYVELRFEGRLRDDRQRLPDFLGATLRGALGFILKRIVCQVSHGVCDRCLLKTACPYPVIFEGMPPAERDVMRKYPRVPQPFVLLPDLGADQENHISWGIRLFGAACRYWPYVIHVFRTACEEGLGRNKVVCDIEQVVDGVSGEQIWDSISDNTRDPQIHQITPAIKDLPEQCVLRWKFMTPVQILKDGSGVGTRVDGLDILLAGRRRVGLMNVFYGHKHDEEVEHRRFEREEFVTRSNRLHHWQIKRFSGRQEKRVELHGVVGEIEIEGPWGLAGDWLHSISLLNLGKSVSFGLGAVEWEVV